MKPDDRNFATRAPKYSILVPAHNGGGFLLDLVTEVLESPRQDFELIVSDDHSTDGSIDTVKALNDPRLTVFQTEKRMSMGEHWDLIEQRAKGSWRVFLGQDDGLQEYGLDLLDDLTRTAGKLGVRAIVAQRAFLNWPGLGKDSPKESVLFSAKAEIKIRSSLVDSWLALLSVRSYHSLPQMYTSCIVHSGLVREIRQQQDGHLIIAHPQDASLAASICLFEKRYLWAGIPFSWVGTSPRSAGKAVLRAISGRADTNSQKVYSSYLGAIDKSSSTYPHFAGDFSIGDNAIYFWQALRVVQDAIGVSRFRLQSRLVTLLVLGLGFVRVPVFSEFFFKKFGLVMEVAKRNRIPGLPAGLVLTLFSVAGGIFIWSVRVVRELRHRVLDRQNPPKNSGFLRVPYSHPLVGLSSVNAKAAKIYHQLPPLPSEAKNFW